MQLGLDDDPALLDLGAFDDLNFFGEVGLLAGQPQLTAAFLSTLEGDEEPLKHQTAPIGRLRPRRAAPSIVSDSSDGDLGTADASELLPGVGGRCLHVDHAQPCCSCSAAPPAEEVDLYELCGDKGKKNGAKLLRSLLKKTPFWSDTKVRADAARKAADAGLDRLVSALVDGHVARLRKEEIIFISNLWGLRSCIWRRRPTGPTRIPAPEMPAPSAGGLKRDAGGLFRQRSNDSKASTVTAILAELDRDDDEDEPEAPPLKKRGAAATAAAPAPAPAPAPAASAERPALSIAGGEAGSTGPSAQSQLSSSASSAFTSCIHIIEEAGEVIMARSTRELCFALGGDGITQAKVEELRTTFAKVCAASTAIAPLKAACEVRLIRLKAAEEARRGKGLVPHAPEEVLADDLVFEVVMRTALNQKQSDVAVLQANLSSRGGLSALDLLDRVTLNAWHKSVEIFHLVVSTLEAARKSNSAIVYLEASVLMQEAVRKYRLAYESAHLYQMAWVEDVAKFAQRRSDEAAAAAKPGGAPAAAPAAEDVLLPSGLLPKFFSTLDEMQQVILSTMPPPEKE